MTVTLTLVFIGCFLIAALGMYAVARLLSRRAGTRYASNELGAFDLAVSTARCDTDLADWARRTMIIVTTHTGFVYGIRLSELRTDPAGLPRTWNVPVSVTVRSAEPGELDGPVDHHHPEGTNA